MSELTCRKFNDRHARLKSALWRAFPDARSENELSILVAEKMPAKRGKPFTDRGVRRWFAGETYPQGRNLIAVGAILTAELAMDLLFGSDTR